MPTFFHSEALTQQNFNAISFSLMGMVIVFCGLIFISVYIYLLPKALAFFRNLFKRKNTVPLHQQENEMEILLAISCAYHIHKNFPEGKEKITWKSHGEIDSPWQVGGRMHSMEVRKRTQFWNRR